VGLAHHLFEREFVAHGREQGRIQATGESKEAIRDPSLTAEQGGHGREHRIQSSGRLSGYDGRSRRPDQDPAVLIYCQALGLDEFGLEVLDIRLIQGKLPLEGPIRHAPLALEQSDHLG
jgi:hypothetical protein